MRNRIMLEENKSSILRISGVFENEDVKAYLNSVLDDSADDLDGDKKSLEKPLIMDQIKELKPSRVQSPFTYEMRD